MSKLNAGASGILSTSNNNHNISSNGHTISHNQSGPRKFRKINLDLILASTTLTRSSKEPHEAYLARVTHLHLQNKRIRKIEGLELCTNLKVLYLYDNQIDAIQNLDFANILQYLYLQNNHIKEIPLLRMPYLRKLYLDENEIKTINNLQECVNLEELHLAKQRIPSFSTLEFSMDSLQAISRTLHVLEISGNNISRLRPFTVLYNLRKLICKDNSVIEFTEVEAIVQLSQLEEANFSGNPCCTLFKYRDMTIGVANNYFSILDDIPIPSHQRVAVKGLMNHRKKIGVMSRFQPNQSSTSYEPRELEGEGSFLEG